MVFSQLLDINKTEYIYRVSTGWSEALLVAHTTLLEISCRGSYIVNDGRRVKISTYQNISVLDTADNIYGKLYLSNSK